MGHGQTMKVGDFGMARYVGLPNGTVGIHSPPNSPGSPSALVRLSPGILGTTQYAAPELINETLRPDGKIQG